MKTAYAELKALRQAWDSLRKARPNEDDFGQFGFAGISASDFDEFFQDWDKGLAAAVNGTKAVNAAEEKILDLIVTKALREARPLVEGARANGFAWLLQSPFLQKIGDLQLTMAPVLERRYRLRRELVQFAQKQLVEDISSIESAAGVAQTLIDAENKVGQQAADVNNALSQSLSAQEKIKAAAEEVDGELKRIGEIAKQAEQSKNGYDSTVNEAKQKLLELNEELASIRKAKKVADEELVSGAERLRHAQDALQKAFSDVNRQGLAGSFQAVSKSLGLERMLWMAAFAVAIIWLVIVAWLMSGGQSSSLIGILGLNLGLKLPADAPIWSGALKALPFSLPGIWLGWLAAKNAGMVGRVQQDYRYKVATAIAFDGYKKEVAATEDAELLKRLLDVAIKNFGDNPIRIYGDKEEYGHPLESLRSIFQDEKTFNRWIEFIKAVKPSIKAAD